ncbi:uncharacterized protein LOC132705969 isoform X1 [Cylas formicarius]|uniref:uncharacterized protein LOC132705969 isoform X1 n=1 Tax=Cylas formicarius TaxID=197179 RepID=UPI00295882E5|nr:uncharacterized protein LOC132705969 isoform X1 [Cylas formicarius]
MSCKRIQVCRICLSTKRKGKVYFGIDAENGIIKNVNNIREMITFCEPEMDLYVSPNPVICETCIPNLVAAYNFKLKCFEVENVIRAYQSANELRDKAAQINLQDVISFKGISNSPTITGNVKGHGLTLGNTIQHVRMRDLSSKGNGDMNVDDDVIVIDDAVDEVMKVPVQNGTINKPHCSNIAFTDVAMRSAISDVIILDDIEDEVTTREDISVTKGSKKVVTRKRKSKTAGIAKSIPRAKRMKLLHKEKRVRPIYRARKIGVPKSKPIEQMDILESVGLQPKNVNDNNNLKLAPGNKTEIQMQIETNNLESRCLTIKLPRTTFFNCEHCSYVSVKEDDLNEHSIKKHGKFIIFSCHLCSFTTKSKLAFQRHCRNQHLEECAARLKDFKILPTHYCSLCKFFSQSRDDFDYHCKYVHYVKVNDSYRCPHCQKGFQLFRDLHFHVEEKHSSGTVVYECAFCNFQCPTKHKIKSHYVWHSKIKLKCLLCPSFSTYISDKFSTHMRELHSAQRYSGLAFLDPSIPVKDSNYRISLEELESKKNEYASPVQQRSAEREPTENNLISGPSLSDLLCSWMMEGTDETDCTIVESELNPKGKECGAVVPESVGNDNLINDDRDDCILIERTIEVINLDSDNENDCVPKEINLHSNVLCDNVVNS